MLLTVTGQCTPAAKCPSVFENRHRITQGRRDYVRVKIDQVRIVRKTIAGGRLGRRYSVGIVTRIAWNIRILQVP